MTHVWSHTPGGKLMAQRVAADIGIDREIDDNRGLSSNRLPHVEATGLESIARPGAADAAGADRKLSIGTPASRGSSSR